MNSKLRVRRVGIDTYRENIAYLPRGCELCKSQGFDALSKIELRYRDRTILATLDITENGIVSPGEIGLSDASFRRLGAPEGAKVSIAHPNPVASIDFVRRKLDGHSLTGSQIFEIVHDISHYRYSNIELTAFVVSCAKRNLSLREIVDLTRAMIETGQTIDWGRPVVLDKHCIGGLPGNRTTMIVVPIVAAFGLTLPKTSSRAITSPAGTADTMEAVANVRLSLARMKAIVAKENACITWGGSIALAPVDDIIISVERPLSLDSEGQMIASILSKKKAAGSTHVLLDIPVGPTTKVRTWKEADRLKRLFMHVGRKIGLKVLVVPTDGRQPIGRGIGPTLEAIDVMKVLECQSNAPGDLREKSLMLAGRLIEFSGKARKGHGVEIARRILESGAALKKFQRIVSMQGGAKKLERAPYSCVITSPSTARVRAIDNRKIAKVARLAGAPTDMRAGVYLHAKVGERVERGKPLYEIFAENEAELAFARHYADENPDIIRG